MLDLVLDMNFNERRGIMWNFVGEMRLIEGRGFLPRRSDVTSSGRSLLKWGFLGAVSQKQYSTLESMILTYRMKPCPENTLIRQLSSG